jgi:hypothetical protein
MGTAGDEPIAGGDTSGGAGGSGGSSGGSGGAGTGGASGSGGSSGGTGGAGGSGGSTGGTGGTGGGGTGGSGGMPVTYCSAASGMPDTCAPGTINHFVSAPVPDAKAYSAPSADLVFDSLTGMTWQRSVAMRDDGTCMGPVRLSLAEAICYCSSLSLPNATSGWRLPSRVELLSILDYAETPLIEPTAFFDTPNDVFWTSSLLGTTVAEGAWHIAFNSGGVTRNGNPDEPHFVRCVKDGWAAPSTPYTAGTGSLADTVLDNATNLRWQTSPTGPGTSAELATSCSAVTIGGRVWRVPTVLELLSLIDETASDPAFDMNFFADSTDASSRNFGSSTVLNGWVECVDFTSGQSEAMQPGDQKWTRCVADD